LSSASKVGDGYKRYTYNNITEHVDTVKTTEYYVKLS